MRQAARKYWLTKRLDRKLARLRSGLKVSLPCPDRATSMSLFAKLPCVTANNGIHIACYYESTERYYCYLCHRSINRTNKYKRVVERGWTAAKEEARIRDAYNEIIIMAEADEWPRPKYLTEPDSTNENYKTQSTLTTADPVGEGNSQS